MSEAHNIRCTPCDLIRDPDGYRKDLGDLTGLRESIEELGLLQPILVSQTEADYVLLAGRRRLAAFRDLGRECIPALLVPVDSEQRILIQCDENACRKALTPMEAVAVARRLRPLVQAAAQKRREAGTRSEEATGETRALVARRVGLSHETLKRAEYVLDHLETLQARLKRAAERGTVPSAWIMLAGKLEALVERMNATDRTRRLSIVAAYRAARTLMAEPSRGETEPLPASPERVVRIVTTWKDAQGKLRTGQVLVNLSMDDTPRDLVVAALERALASYRSEGESSASEAGVRSGSVSATGPKNS